MPPTEKETLAEILQLSKTNAAEISAARADLLDVQELLSAWRNARGAIHVLQVIGSILRWFTLVGGSLSIIVYWLTGRGPSQ